MLSLRTRVLFGAVLWTFGLVLLSFVIIAHVFQHAPDMPFLGRRGSIHIIWGSHATLIICTTIIALIGGAYQVRRGLAGVTQLRASLAAMHEGSERRVDGTYVPEVQPLVDDLNALLEQREQAVQRALARAGDLAHGLKTPLALLARESERAAEAGQPDLATAIEQQVARMQRHVDYHLAHARAAASGGHSNARTLLHESVDGLVRTLSRLHAERQLAIDVRIPPSMAVRVQREDLDEMLGNLLENACKWTRSRVNIGADAGAATIAIIIDDDGPGLRADLRTTVLQRGVRADEQVAGTGIGLAIVRDLAHLYGGAIELTESPPGGLRATLTLPRVDV
jgi:signal transduction histidine kinase